MRHLLLTLALLLSAPQARADILPGDHTGVKHTFEVRGLEQAPEGTRFFAYPTDMLGGARWITDGEPFRWYKFAHPRIYAGNQDTGLMFEDSDLELDLPVSATPLDLVSSVPSRHRTREIRTVYTFRGLKDGHVLLELLSETRYDGNGKEVSSGSGRILPRAWTALPLLAIFGLVHVVRRRRATA